MKKLLFVLVILCTFGLVGCKKKSKQLKNEELSEEQLGHAFSIATTWGFMTSLYMDEETFETDPTDSNCEIGYAFTFNGYELDEDLEEESIDNYVGCVEHFRVKRDKETRRIVDYLDHENDATGNTYEIKYIPQDLNFLVSKGFYKITYTEYDQYGNMDFDTATIDKITKEEALKYIKMDFWIIPNNEFDIIYKTNDKGVAYPQLDVTLKGEEKVGFARTHQYDSKDKTGFAFKIENTEGAGRTYYFLWVDRVVNDKLREAYTKK